MSSHHSHYLFQVVPLFLQCEENLKMTISRIHFSPGRYESLYRLQKSLLATEKLLCAYVFEILRENEIENENDAGQHYLLLDEETSSRNSNSVCDMLRALEYIKHMSSSSREKKNSNNNNNNTDDESSSVSSSVSSSGRHRRRRRRQEANTVGGRRSSFYANQQSQSAPESQLLFRLIVIFQLLLVRIDDAHSVITGYRIEEEEMSNGKNTNNKHDAKNNQRGSSCTTAIQMQNNNSMSLSLLLLPSLGVCCLGAAGMIAGFLGRKQMGNANARIKFTSWSSVTNYCNRGQLIGATAKLGSSLFGFVLLRGFLNVCWMTDKIIRSNSELLDWNHQWELIHCIAGTRSRRIDHRGGGYQHYSSSPSPSLGLKTPESSFSNEQPMEDDDDSSIDMDMDIDEKSRTLIEYAQKHGRKSYFWRSTGEIRFLMVKRFMDIYYASVGVGVHCTKDNPNNSIFLPLVAGAAASFYAITGAPTPTVVNDASSRDLIQHAWGMVSLPVLKDLMLQASRLVKGASVADRIVLCGVPCFILSKDPAPELAAVLQRQAKVRTGDSSANLSRLSTIAETEIHLDDVVEKANTASRRKNFAGSKGQYRQRDVILHLTGGGFFAHTIASDLPYLLDWSSSTGSVVICPEYSLLPENQFPTQLNQIAAIYAALANGNTGEELGFDANSIIVTGESAGGNLAAALCVKLALQNIKAECEAECDSDDATRDGCSQPPSTAAAGKALDTNSIEPPPNHRMPDAIMLSCPALNLTTELSHSRVIGTEDPVLPNALISAISEAYLPPGVDNKDSLVSPFYAPDRVLRRFPPTLLFASSKDPLLDDSVTFNERLRVLGVDSELMAVHNVPHAYLGLGTAGFPEAVQVQQYAMDWLSSKFS